MLITINFCLNICFFLIPIIAIFAPGATTLLLVLSSISMILYYKLSSYKLFFYSNKIYIFFITSFFLLVIFGCLNSENLGFSFERSIKLLILFLIGYLLIKAPIELLVEQNKKFPPLFISGFILGFFLVFFEMSTGYAINKIIWLIDSANENKDLVAWYNWSTVFDFQEGKSWWYAFDPFVGLNKNVLRENIWWVVSPAIVLNRAIIILAILSWPTMLASRLVSNSIIVYLIPLFILFLSAFSFSDSASLAMLAGLVVFMISSINFKPTFNFIYASVAIFVLGMPLIVKYLYLYFYNFLIQYFSWSSPGFRLELYHFVSNKIFDKPFFGWGIDSLRFMTFTNVDIKTNNYQFLIEGGNVLHPHSWYLQIWLDFGMFGAIIFVGSIFVLMQKINQMSGFAKRMSLSALVCSLCSLSFSFGLYQTWLLSFLILLVFLILYLSNIEKQKNQV